MSERILTWDEVQALWDKGERNRAMLQWTDLRSLVRSHEALRVQRDDMRRGLRCTLNLDSPSYPPDIDERRQCSCWWCRFTVSEAESKSNKQRASEADLTLATAIYEHAISHCPCQNDGAYTRAGQHRSDCIVDKCRELRNALRDGTRQALAVYAPELTARCEQLERENAALRKRTQKCQGEVRS